MSARLITAAERAARRRQPMRGLGDVIAVATKSVGIKPCKSCNGRIAWLNRLLPFPAGQTNQPSQDPSP